MNSDNIVTDFDNLISKANESDGYQKDTVTMDSYKDSATEPYDGAGSTNVDVAAMDANGDVIEVDDIVDSTQDEDKAEGIIREIGKLVTVEWPDGTTSDESALSLVLSNFDEDEDDDDEYEKDVDIEDDEEDQIVYPTGDKESDIYEDEIEDIEDDEDEPEEIANTNFPV